MIRSALENYHTGRGLIDVEMVQGLAVQAMDELPPCNGDSLWSCHAVARYVQQSSHSFVAWQVVDGYYAGAGNEHSWLEHGSEDRRRMILDVLPIAGLAIPMIYDGNWLAPASRLYVPHDYPGTRVVMWEAEFCQARNAARELYHQRLLAGG